MKKLFRYAVIAAALITARAAFAGEVTYNDSLVNNASLAYSTAPIINLNENEVDNLTMQAVYSSSTLSSVTFDDGTPGNGQITVISTSNLTGMVIALNGCRLKEGDNFTAVATTTGTAKAISDAIVASSCLSSVITSTYSASIVYATATATGVSTNYSMFSSNASSVTVSGTAFTGGTTSDVSVANDTIESVTRHGWSTGVPVLFSTAGTPPTGLTDQTTYYAIVTSPYQFKLASTSTGSLAGVPVNITAQTTLGGGSFTLAPLSTDGTFGFKWQVSNDNVNWTDLSTTANGVSISSVTFPPPYTAASSIWDFGPITWAHIRAYISAGTAGAWNLKITGNGKKFR